MRLVLGPKVALQWQSHLFDGLAPLPLDNNLSSQAGAFASCIEFGFEGFRAT